MPPYTEKLGIELRRPYTAPEEATILSISITVKCRGSVHLAEKLCSFYLLNP